MHELQYVQRQARPFGVIFVATCSCGMDFTARSRGGAKGKAERHIEFLNLQEWVRDV